MKIQPMYLVQQETAIDEHYRFLRKLVATGNVEIHCPPDCFIWTGTKEDLEQFMKENK